MDDANFLPNDLEQCQRLLLAAFKHSTELEERADQLQRVLDATAASHEELRGVHEATVAELNALKRWIYGRRRERFTEGEGQQHLFELAPEGKSDDSPTAEPVAEQQQVAGHTRRRRRELDLSHLPHHRHQLDLSPEEKTCSCCDREMDRIGEDVTRVLEHVPSKLEVHEHIRPKYACRYCKNGVTSPAPPERPIARGIAGPGLIAQIVVSKYGDHLPLYRQEDIFVRHGLHIARSTQCDWISAAADLLRPLFDLQCKLVLQSTVLWTDDTPVKVLYGGQEGSRQGRFWTYIGDQEHPYSVYDFTMSRSRDGPQNFLEAFQGYLQADAYAGYDAIFLGSGDQIIEVACWAHARRKFFDARKNYPREAHQVLDWIVQLYDIEDRALPFSAEARCELRQREADPLLDKIEAYLGELSSRVLPKSALGKAVSYAQNQWQALRCYTTDGRLTIDNNTSERTLRHQAIGRKNWLFLGSQEGGSRAAVLYSILAGAKRHRIEPWVYVRDLLIRLHAEDSKLESMLPDRWAIEHPEAILQHRLEESRAKAAKKSERRKHRRKMRGKKPR